ncbi:MAG: FKBP-type peptidyl-prolyl cis-trans isomerase [Candidatus Azotimanducaceae bacterium]|jgi:FKBP-type peptidyl-prolyl cis-trans isomerase FkpA
MNKFTNIKILLSISIAVSSISMVQYSLAEGAEVAAAVQPEAVAGPRKPTAAEMGYFFGYSFGNMLIEGGTVQVDFDALSKGMADSMGGVAPSISQEAQAAVAAEVRAKQEQVQRQRVEMQNQISNEQKTTGETFLAENARKPGIQTTPSGLQYQHQLEGEGGMPTAADTVEVHYVGTLLDGTEFDSSIKRGQPASFGLGQVIPGWTEGLQLMRVGGKTRFFIPSDLGYGPGGTRGIPPNSVLVFDVELLSIK